MSKVFKYDKAEESPGFLLWKVSNFWQREIRKALVEFGLTHTQFVVLANAYYLGLRNENVTQVDIASQIGIDKMLTSNVLKALLKKELVTREEHKTDTRAKTIRLTKVGAQLLKKAVRSVEEFDKSFFGQLENSNSFNSQLLILLNH